MPAFPGRSKRNWNKYLTNVPMLLVLLFVHARGAPVYEATETAVPPASALKFMKRFGYLEAGTVDSEALYTAEAIVDAVKRVQTFGNLPVTGTVDNDTLNLMDSPRCGVADIIRHRTDDRAKRYIVGSDGWKKRDITYFIANWTPKIGEEAVIEETDRAFRAWSGYSRLKFHRVNNPDADIIIAFGRGSHGDGYPFDGTGNVLAHAFFPYEMGSYGGDMHFDDDEDWKVQPSDAYDGTDFFSVAVHELGHSLGLSHSPISSSVMFPYYRGHTPHFQLDYDDILGLYQLYISRPLEGDRQAAVPETTDATEGAEDTSTESTTAGYGRTDESGDKYEITETDEDTATYSSTTEYATAVTEDQPRVTFVGDYETVDEHRNHENGGTTESQLIAIPDICEGSYDAISVFRNELFIFKGEYVWRLEKRGKIDNGYPVKLHQLFFHLPENITRIDAAYQRESDGNIVLFTGNAYWIYDGNKFLHDSPRPITDYGISANVDKIDAVQTWTKNKKTYLYSRDRFWRFNETSRSLDPGYPKHMRRWRGVPTDIDAAMTWIDGKTYFFKDTLFWKFDNFFVKTDERYPLPASQYWIGCPEKLDTVWW